MSKLPYGVERLIVRGNLVLPVKMGPTHHTTTGAPGRATQYTV